MKTLAILTILLIVVANVTLSSMGNNDSIMDRILDHHRIRMTATTPPAFPLMPFVGSVALVGVCLLMDGTAKKSY